MSRRVVITGIGVVSGIGTGTTAFWNACLAGESCVAPIPEHWRTHADFSCPVWSPLGPERIPTVGISRVEMMQIDMTGVIGMGAAFLALDDAGLSYRVKDAKKNTFAVDAIDPHRAGVFMGTGVGGIASVAAAHSHHLLARPKQRLGSLAALHDAVKPEIDTILGDLVMAQRFNPFAVSMIMPNAISALLGIKFQLQGPNRTHCAACASGTVAIGQAFRAIRGGEVDMAFAGGAEYLDDETGATFRGFDIAKTLVKPQGEFAEANRPFDAARSGFLFSQGGAAVLVLEEYESALARKAEIVAEIAGYAETFDAHNVMIMEPSGAAIERMITETLKDASVRPSDVDYVNTHGTGTIGNDELEAAIIGRMFGNRPLVNATKSLLGHTIGAAGALEAAVTALSLKNQRTHACLNLDNPIADLNFVRKAGAYPMSTALTHSFAFGGHNAGLVLKSGV